MAWLENKAGAFIQPHGGSGLATLLNVPMPDNLRVFAPDPEGDDFYVLLFVAASAVRRAALCLRIMPSWTYRRYPRMLKQTVFAGPFHDPELEMTPQKPSFQT